MGRGERALIIGVGHDLAEIDRIAALLQSNIGERFLGRILTDAEQEEARARGARAAEYVAGRFAAKEAVVKALGCGIGAKVAFADIEVLPGEAGKPVCRLSARSWERLGLDREHVRIHITITHIQELASAVAIAEQIGGD